MGKIWKVCSKSGGKFSLVLLSMLCKFKKRNANEGSVSKYKCKYMAKLHTITHVYGHIFPSKGASTLRSDVFESEISSSHKLQSSIQLKVSEHYNSRMCIL